MRDHIPIEMMEFSGLWRRGDVDSCPPNHFTESINIQFIQGGFETRDGIDQYINKQNIVRIYTFNTSLDGFLILDNTGKIYHVISGVSITQILSITNMTDFKYVNINNRAIISPIGSGIASGNKFLYVYNGAGVTARKAAGVPPVNADGALAAANGAAGSVEAGYHVFGVVYETDSGFLTQIGPDTLPALNATGALKVNLTAIPVSGSSAVTKRHIVASKTVLPADWIGDTRGQQFFFVPNGTINDNSTTTLTVDFFDSQLIDDASHLLEIFSEIPSANHLTTYHGRLVALYKTATASFCYVSTVDEPEAIDSVTGIIDIPDNGLGLLAAHVYRDVLYLYKINFTIAVNDNNDEPSTWPKTVIDEGIGCGMHGVCIVGVYQGGTNVEYLVTLDYNGIWIFDGVYRRPELSWKIADYWHSMVKTQISDNYEIYNDPLSQRIYINLTDIKTILVGDYTNELDFKIIKWTKWTFDNLIPSITLFDKDNKLILASATWIYNVTSAKTNDNWSSGATKIPNPTVRTGFIEDEKDDTQVTHYGGIKVRINGTGNLRGKFYGIDDVLTSTLPVLAMSSTPGKIPFILANFVNQRARLELQTTAINEEMKVNTITTYLKPIYTSLPQ